jgi:hypothetical protein
LGKVIVVMEAEVKAVNPVNISFITEIVVVEYVIDTSSGTFGVRLSLPNAVHKISAVLCYKINFIEKNKVLSTSYW